MRNSLFSAALLHGAAAPGGARVSESSGVQHTKPASMALSVTLLALVAATGAAAAAHLPVTAAMLDAATAAAADARAARPMPSAGVKRLSCIGDSITAGVCANKYSGGYPTILQSLFGNTSYYVGNYGER